MQLQRRVFGSPIALAAHDDIDIISAQRSSCSCRLRVHASHGRHRAGSGLIGGHLLHLGLQPLLAEAALGVAVGDLAQHFATTLLADAALSEEGRA